MTNIVNYLDKEEGKIKGQKVKNNNNSNFMSPYQNKTKDKIEINNRSGYHDKNLLISPELSVFGRSLNNQSKYYNLLINNGKSYYDYCLLNN